MGRAKDVRLMVVYGYARLVGYERDYRLAPDIVEDLEVEEGRIFTLRLRPGHRWSDGRPFTSEDFRYYWEDIATNATLAPFGPPRAYLVEGEPPRFEVLDEHTVRYAWPRPNPFFLPALAGARPETLYAPAHYLQAFHARYADEDALNEQAREEGKRNWAAVHTSRFRPYKNTNPDLPTLQPWVNTTAPPSQRFVFVRNPWFHRTDTNGRQLPYIDRVVINISDGKLIPAKTGAGESDLQARHLTFNDYTFLKQSEKRNAKQVRLWETTRGAHVALYPNLNVADPGWRALMHDARFRRALSLAIDRHEINQVIYFGLATEGNDTVHEKGPLYEQDYRTRWARFDLDAANALLDEIGLLERNAEGIRLMPDGRPLEIIVETAGEDTEQTDVLELVGWTWKGGRYQGVLQAAAARGVPEPHRLGPDRGLGVERARERAAARRHEPPRPRPDPAGSVPVAAVGTALRERRCVGRSAGARSGARARRVEPRLALRARYRRPARDLGADARDPGRQRVQHRHRLRGAAAGGGGRAAAQRPRAGHLQLGPRRPLRHLPPRHLLVRGLSRPCCNTPSGASS